MELWSWFAFLQSLRLRHIGLVRRLAPDWPVAVRYLAGVVRYEHDRGVTPDERLMSSVISLRGCGVPAAGACRGLDYR